MPRIMTPDDVAEFRRRLCEVGAELFAEKGFAGFNMRELAHRLGVSAMTPYRYFKDKSEILAEVRARAFARFADWLVSALAAPGADGGTLASAYAEFAVQQEKQYRLMFDLTSMQPGALPAQAAEEWRLKKLMLAHVTGHLEETGYGAEQMHALSLALWAALHGTTALYISGKLSRQEFDWALMQTVRLFCRSGGERRTISGFNALNDDESMPLREAMRHNHAHA